MEELTTKVERGKYSDFENRLGCRNERRYKCKNRLHYTEAFDEVQHVDILVSLSKFDLHRNDIIHTEILLESVRIG